jgi:16S rRNA (cytosine1402-N4)-methyltransferase
VPIREDNIRCFNLQNKKPITPSSEEIKLNPPSRSAKLRFAVKIKNECNFEEFINKFKQLTDIEDLQFDK